MVKKSKKIRWDKEAMVSFKSAISYIRNDSEKNAEKVRRDLLSKINSLKEHPEKYSLDKFRRDNNGIFRAFELHHYRVTYSVTEKEIIITRVRHTSMEPLAY